MKRIVIAGFSVLLLSLSAIAAKAQTDSTPVQVRQLTPAQLVDFAYRGQIDGIPGFQRFVRARYQADELVQQAAEAGAIAPETVEDGQYINAVRSQLRGFRPHRFND
ncbi:MAG: hypothetical protein AAFY67_03365 [Cyanobacteria bacterium J06642_9]